VHRTQSEQDARVYWLELTPVGNERLARAVARNGPERRRLLDLLSEAA
jgi:DNA-binding MarR family transcriptional regulator